MKKIIVLSMIVAACSGESLTVDLSNTSVVLDVFSGRPNPSWPLTPTEVGELENRLTGLPETSPAAIPDNLGYRGFYIEDVEHSDRITVTSNGYVIVRRNNHDTFYRDTKGVEDLLIEQAQTRGFSDLVVRPRARQR